MPARNRKKEYLENSYYHIYNRGVEKRTIFLDLQDYNVFLSYLQTYLIPKDIEHLQECLADITSSPREKDKARKLLRLNNFSEEISLIAYCLMPNHFHFFIKQNHAESMDIFMNSLATRYTMYFNKKYKRVGSLYQGVYKAVSVETENQLLHLSRYIHKQALALQGQALQTGQPSSYLDYIGEVKNDWVHPEEVINYFSEENPTLTYRAFMDQDEIIDDISPLILEDS